MRKAAIILLLCGLVCSCAHRGGKSARTSSRQFPTVIIPGMVTHPQQRLEYAAAHFWDAFLDYDASGQDTSVVCGVARKDFEQAVSNFAFALSSLDLDLACKDILDAYDKFLAKDGRLCDEFTKFVEYYLYDCNSPLRNEDVFQPLAERLSLKPELDSLTREKYGRISRLASLNRMGSRAADFSFSDKSGRRGTLYGIKADYTVLFFSNPGCKSCREIIDALSSNPKVSGDIADGKLAVANIYIDEDISAWREYMPIYPENWLNGFDPDGIIRNDCLYNVRAIPSLYLLDAQKKVLLKDAPVEKLLALIERI